MRDEDDDLAAQVAAVLSVGVEEFDARVREDAAALREAIDDGAFDNHQSMIGLEYEFYGVDADGALQRIPRPMIELTGFEKELGLHNVEMNTTPQPVNPAGLAAQEHEIRARLTAARGLMGSEGQIVSDALWTVPPVGETAREYLTDSVERSVEVGGTERTVRIASNMSDAARYHAMANTHGARAAGMRVDAPNVTLEATTVMPESLITSIQPHYQLRQAADLPTHFTYALRIAGPLLALGANSPFFPPDCYDAVSAQTVLDEAWMEHRIGVFESVLNGPDGSLEKVRFPRDLESVQQAIERIVEDPTFVPMPVDRGNRFDDAFAHFRCKHGTYWRWVRPVFEGESRQHASTRIEFRPVSSQPTVRDTVAFQAVFAGLMESLPRRRHPVGRLSWEDARENFYAAARDGLDASFRWISNDGEEVTEPAVVLEELLEYAEDGLQTRGLSPSAAREYTAPLRYRIRHGLTPADWKWAVVDRAVADGRDLAGAIDAMQRRYVELQAESLLEGSFVDWPEADGVGSD